MAYTCTVCGHGGLSEVPDQSFEICPRCLTEFGYDDHGPRAEALREQWSYVMFIRVPGACEALARLAIGYQEMR